MKKILFLACLAVCLFLPIEANAATSSIRVSHSRSNVVVGNTFTTSVTISSSEPLGAWNFDVKYDSSKLQLTNSSFGGTYIVDVGDGRKKSVTYTFTFKAKASGTTKVYIANSQVLAYNESLLTPSNGSASVKIMTQSELEESYSKNNYLSSLTVEGATLDPVFDKNTVTYKVELENDVTSIQVAAKAEDWKSKISGTGEIKVSEGENKIEVKVTAENGNVRTYTINATVKELSPVTVTIDGKDYNIIRKKENLTAPSTFTETTVTIQGEEIPAFYNEITKYTLVGLKDKEGNINLYIYDSTKETYTLYRELVFNRIVFQVMEAPAGQIPKNYQKTTISLFNQEVTAYKWKETSRFALLYGKNMENGNEGFYVYDNLEETLQRYDVDQQRETSEENQKYLIGFFVLGGISIILAGILLGIGIHNLRKKKTPKQEKIVLAKHGEKENDTK